MTKPVPQSGQDNRASCPAMMIAAPASNQGKTTITAGLARYHRNAGRRVRVFKIGPDFIDPMILERASGAPVEQLDLWMVGQPACRAILTEAARDADIILLEGVMGLFDGTPSSADLAKAFGVPVMLVIDASAMAQSFGALVHGYTSYDPELAIAGVLANRVGSESHGGMLPDSIINDTAFLGYVLRDDQASLPDRHLGLVQADEIDGLDDRLNRVADQIGKTELANLPDEITFTSPPLKALPELLDGMTIACASDLAFSFIYQANLRCLRDMGADIITFSPLTDSTIPDCDAIYLPGGYPELHLETLSQNQDMRSALKAAHADDTPILAECGGLLYLLETLESKDGHKASMAGILPGSGKLQKKLSAIGLQSVSTREGELHGHTFHHSTLDTPLDVTARATSPRFNRQGEAVYSVGNMVASYVHFYFPSCPAATARLFLRGSREGLFSCD